MRAPAESISQKTGSSSRSAASVARTIFSTVRAPHDPAFTVGAFRATTPPPPPPPLQGGVVGDDDRRPAVDGAAPRHDAVRGQADEGVGELTVLDERPLIDEQSDALAHRQLALPAHLARTGARRGRGGWAAPAAAGASLPSRACRSRAARAPSAGPASAGADSAVGV